MQGFYSELLGSNSFSSIWYWLMVAIVWSRATHWTLGVPFEMARLGQRLEGQFQTDFESQVEMGVRRYTYIFREYGYFLVGFGAFFLAFVATLGFGFQLQFMQAVFLLLFPLSIAGLISVRFAFDLQKRPVLGGELFSKFQWHRRLKQVIGTVSILFSTFWGMSQVFFDHFL